VQKKNDIKKKFKNRFTTLRREEKYLDILISKIFDHGTAYVVGGFFRDFLNDQKSRDIDIIVDIKDVCLLDIVESLNCSFETNRFGGIKLRLETITVDLWSIEDNWAFKEHLVKLNENYKLDCIAKSCFFNYDSLVINLQDFTYNLKYYKDFKSKTKLDILGKTKSYKNLNPTIEANIIRAIFIKNKFNAELTDNTYSYLLNKLGYLKDSYQDEIQRLVEVKQKYPKYKELSDTILQQEVKCLMKSLPTSKHLFI
jgi:hypothetical protein